jgi:hypothetical protein
MLDSMVSGKAKLTLFNKNINLKFWRWPCKLYRDANYSKSHDMPSIGTIKIDM